MPRLTRVPALLALVALLAACHPDQPVSSRDTPAPGAPQRTQALVVGTVRDRGGKPVAHVWVRPRSLDQPARAIPEILVTTDQQGRYRWTLVPGRYAIEAGQGSGTPDRREVSLAPGQTATVDFTLP